MKIFVITILLMLPFKSSMECELYVPEITERVEEKVIPIEYQIFNTLVDHGIDTIMARILVAQASVESGKFRNPLTKQHCNVFSIMHSDKRETTSLGPYGYAEGRYGYCSYPTIDASAVDMILYMKARDIPTDWRSTSDYCRYLKKRRYYESDENDYIKAVWSTYKRIWN